MIAPETINQLYKTYLGRELTPEQMAEVTDPSGKYATYDTPEKLETLLGSTSNSIKNRTLSKIDQNISNLKSGTNLFGGKLPDYLTYQNQNPELSQANQELDTATSGYDQITQRAGAAPSKTKDLLKSGAQFFGDSYDDINKRYSDPNSAWYVSDPQLRRGVVDNATKSKQSAMESVISKIQDIYSVLTTAATNQLASKSDKVQTILKGVEKSYDSLMAYYGQEEADRKAKEAADLDFQRQKEMAGIEHGYNMEEIGANKSGGPSQADKDETQFNQDISKEVNNVLTGQYGKEMSREIAIATLVSMYPDREQEIKDKIYGKPPVGQENFNVKSGNVGGLLPDGYENKISSNEKYTDYYKRKNEIDSMLENQIDATSAVQSLINDYPEKQTETRAYFGG